MFKTCNKDSLAVMGCKLKRMLSCLMVINVLDFIFGGGLYSLLGFSFHLIGFLGAHKRHTRMLATFFYGAISLIVFAVVVSFFALAAGPAYVDDGSASSTSPATPTSSDASGAPHPTPEQFSYAYRRLFDYSAKNTTYESSETATVTTTGFGAGLIFLSILELVLFFLIIFMKIYTLVLAHRMRKVLNTPALPVAVEQQANTHDEHETARLTTPVPVENGAYPFMQPNFMPFPYHMNGQAGVPSVLPPPLMYGQQPVFYTYTPMNFPYPNQQQPTQTSDEKQ